jgi:hypothetical protein
MNEAEARAEAERSQLVVQAVEAHERTVESAGRKLRAALLHAEYVYSLHLAVLSKSELGTPEPRPFSPEFERLYAEYTASGATQSWESWLVSRRPSSLADALAKVDQKQDNRSGFTRADEYAELEALRGLAVAVRAHFQAHPEVAL